MLSDTFCADNQANHTLASSGFNECHDAEFYSDITRTVFQPGDTHHVLDPTKPLSDVPGVARFLNISDPWITQIKEVRRYNGYYQIFIDYVSEHPIV